MFKAVSRGADGVVLLAKGGSLLLGAAAMFFGFVVLKSIYDFLLFGPEKGATGVFMIDSMFGGFVLFLISRLLWIYARKRQRRFAADNTAEE